MLKDIISGFTPCRIRDVFNFRRRSDNRICRQIKNVNRVSEPDQHFVTQTNDTPVLRTGVACPTRPDITQHFRPDGIRGKIVCRQNQAAVDTGQTPPFPIVLPNIICRRIDNAVRINRLRIYRVTYKPFLYSRADVTVNKIDKLSANGGEVKICRRPAAGFRCVGQAVQAASENCIDIVFLAKRKMHSASRGYVNQLFCRCRRFPLVAV